MNNEWIKATQIGIEYGQIQKVFVDWCKKIVEVTQTPDNRGLPSLMILESSTPDVFKISFAGRTIVYRLLVSGEEAVVGRIDVFEQHGLGLQMFDKLVTFKLEKTGVATMSAGKQFSMTSSSDGSELFVSTLKHVLKSTREK